MFRRKRTAEQAASGDVSRSGDGEPTGTGDASASADVTPMPQDVDDVDLEDGIERIDLGGLIIEPGPGQEVQLQVDQETNQVQAILLTNGEGAVEVRPFAAPRGGDLWGEVRGEIADDINGRGGQCEEREGPWGTEIFGVVPVQVSESEVRGQPSRIVGINGPRWMLRATFLGQPAVEPDSEAASQWQDVLGRVVVRRGKEAMPVGDPLPLVLPPQARAANPQDEPSAVEEV